MISSLVQPSTSLEKEYRFCIDSQDWFLLGRLLEVSDFAFQFDETWNVSNQPLKIARIRNQSGRVSISYKTILSKVQSLEEEVDLSSSEARSFFDSHYKKDLTISKLRGTKHLRDVIVTLDLVDAVGHCIEIEGDNDQLKKHILSCLELNPDLLMDGYGFYIRAGIQPSPLSIGLDRLHLLKELT